MRFFKSLLFAAVVMSLIVVTVAVAAPNFGGTWKLDAAKSESMMGSGGRGPTDMTMVIEHKGDMVSVKRTSTYQGQERTSTVEFKTDGSECKNKDRRGNEVIYRAKWQGDKLVVTYTRSFGGGSSEVTETWSLADKVLTMDNQMKSSRGDRTYKSVFNKVG